MATPTDPREARLPKWAQAELASLRRRIADLKDDFEEYADAALDRDRHVVVTGAYGEHPKPVAEAGEAVRFYLDGFDGYRWIDVTVPSDGAREVEVMASAGLRIAPHVTNRLTLTLTRD